MVRLSLDEDCVALLHGHGLPLDVEDPLAFQDDVDLVVLVRLLAVGLGCDQHVDAQLEPAGLDMRVRDGEVAIAGEVETKSDAELLADLIGQVPGVVSVDSKLTWKVAASIR